MEHYAMESTTNKESCKGTLPQAIHLWIFKKTEAEKGIMYQ